MHNLTTADVAFLLCTSQQQAGPQLQLTLETTYGLIIDLNPDGSVTTRLKPPSSELDLQEDEDEPITPIQTSPTLPRPRAFFPATCTAGNLAAPTSSIDEILCTPISPTPSANLFRAALLGVRNKPSLPDTQPQRVPVPVKRGFQYRIQPDWHEPSPSYVWYAPSSPENSSDEEEPVPEDELEVRYGGEWFDAYLDWVERLEEALHRCGNRDWGNRFRNPFADDGMRTLWMVEGLLLTSWLSLQGDVGSVEYQPGEEVFTLGGGRIDGVLKKLLGR